MIEAFIVKALKKSKNPLTKTEISEWIKVPEELCSMPLSKVISKGMVEKVGEQ